MKTKQLKYRLTIYLGGVQFMTSHHGTVRDAKSEITRFANADMAIAFVAVVETANTGEEKYTARFINGRTADKPSKAIEPISSADLVPLSDGYSYFVFKRSTGKIWKLFANGITDLTDKYSQVHDLPMGSPRFARKNSYQGDVIETVQSPIVRDRVLAQFKGWSEGTKPKTDTSYLPDEILPGQVKETLECTASICETDFHPVRPVTRKTKPRLPKIKLTLKIDKRNSDIQESLVVPSDLVGLLGFLSESPEENFIAVLVNAKHEAIGIHEISRGTLSASLVHPREVFKAAILANAYGMFVAHNHPSGSALKPSIEDIETTEQLIAAGKLLGINLIDHLILSPTPGEYWSFRENRSDLWSL